MRTHSINFDHAAPENNPDYTRVVSGLTEVLPKGWVPRISSSVAGPTLTIVSPDGSNEHFRLRLKRRFEPRDIAYLRYADRDSNHIPTLLVSAFLSERSQSLLQKERISYIDFNDNIWISANSVYIDRKGSEGSARLPRTQQTRSTLRGPKTARIIRYLCEVEAPLKVRDIATATAMNAGNISRILELLTREGLITRNRGSVASTDWEALIKHWAPDYAKDRHITAFLEPQGLPVLLKKLKQTRWPYALTGAYASAQLAPAAMPVAVDIYVANIEAFASDLGIDKSDRVGNVRLIQSPDRVTLENTLNRSGLILASPAQIAADLLTLPKRSKVEYEALIRWMKEHETDWRR